MLQNRSCSHRLRPVIYRLLGTNYTFTLTTTGTVPTTTESWRTATKLCITLLIMYRNVSTFHFISYLCSQLFHTIKHTLLPLIEQNSGCKHISDRN